MQTAFISNHRQWEVFSASKAPDPGLRVAVHDLDIFCRAEAAGYRVVNLWRHVPPAVSLYHWNTAWAVCDRVGAALARRVVVAGADIVERVKYDLVYPTQYALNVVAMVFGLLQEQPPGGVLHFGETSSVAWDDPPEPPPDIFNAAASWAAGQINLPCEVLSAGRADSQAPTGVRAAGPTCLPRRLPGSPCRVVDFVGVIGEGEQQQLLDDIDAGGAADWLLVTAADARRGLPAVRQLNLERLPFNLVEVGASVAAFRRDGLPNCAPPAGRLVDGFLRSEQARFIWESFCDRLLTGARFLLLSQFLCSALRPRLIMLGYDVSGPVRCLVEGARASGVRTLTISHAGLWNAMGARRHVGTRGNIGVLGSLEADGLHRLRAEGRIFKVGSMRPDFAAMGARQPVSPGAMPGRRRKIVFLTALVGDVNRTAACPLAHAECWDQIAGYCRSRPEADFVIKSHPRYDYHALYDKVVGSSGGNVTRATGVLEDVLAGADVAVMVNYPGTVALDAMSLGIPVVYLRAAMLPDLREDLSQGAITVGGIPEMADVIEKLSSDARYLESVMAGQRDFMRRAVAATGSDAARRVREVAELLAAESGKSGEPSQGGRWLIDFIVAVEYGMGGLLAPDRFRERLQVLAREGRTLTFTNWNYLRGEKMGAYFLDLVLWGARPATAVKSVRSIVWAVYLALPRPVRPPLNVLRSRLVHACLLDAEAARGSAAKRMVDHVLPWVLAPGRIRSLFPGPAAGA